MLQKKTQREASQPPSPFFLVVTCVWKNPRGGGHYTRALFLSFITNLAKRTQGGPLWPPPFSCCNKCCEKKHKVSIAAPLFLLLQQMLPRKTQGGGGERIMAPPLPPIVTSIVTKPQRWHEGLGFPLATVIVAKKNTKGTIVAPFSSCCNLCCENKTQGWV